MTPVAEKNKILVISLDKNSGGEKPKIKKLAFEIFEILKKKKISLDIYLADGSLMKKLNKTLRGKNKSADVLSFEEPRGFVEPRAGFRKIGEVFLNFSYLRGKGKDKNSETKKLLVHGALHLLGYDHETDKEGDKMERKEKIIIDKLK